MDEDRVQKIRSILPAGMGAGVAAVLILLVGRVTTMSPFETTRPPDPRVRVSQANPNLIDARLWEDPLKAVSGSVPPANVEIAATVSKELDLLLNGREDDRSSTARPRGTVAIIAVALDGSSTTEATESRLRTRVAVVSALAQRGLIPEGDGGLYLAATKNEADGALWLMPLTYEIFRFDPFGQGARHQFEETPTKLNGAVVVWLDEGWIAGDEQSGTIAKMSKQLAQLLDQARFPASRLGSLRFLAVAPVTSRLLANVAEELAGQQLRNPAESAPERTDQLVQVADGSGDAPLAAGAEPLTVEVLQKEISERIEVYSPRATTPLPLARIFGHRGSSAGTSRGASDRGWSWRSGLSMPPERFTPAVLSDQDMAASLVDELGRRGVRLFGTDGDGAARDHLVLVSEWDTLYGRALPFMFEVELTRRTIDAGPNSRYEDLYDYRLTNRIQAPSNVHRFTYLRGLDGETREPAQAAAGDDDGKAAPGSPAAEHQARLRKLEGSEGPRQLDMIRRVGDSIATLDRELRLRRQGRVAAIGILGSDFHDKVMVLQSLRPQFSDAIFFTTDIDARLLHPRWYSLVRNLVVASSYGLELAPELQCQTPPFRDSYATATFAAVLAGLQRVDPRVVLAGDEKRPGACVPLTVAHLQQFRPLLFEIGRNGAVALAPVEDRLGTHPQPLDPRPTARRVALLCFPLLLVLFWFLSTPLARLLARSSDPGDARVSRWRWVIAGVAMAIVFASWRVALVDAHGGGEPLYWLKGVSAWPSELVWMVATLLSVLLLARAVTSLRDDAEKVSDYFVEKGAPQDGTTQGSTAECGAAGATSSGTRPWVSWLAAGWRNLGLRQWDCKSTKAADVWQSYCEAGQLRWRFARVAVSVAAVATLMGFLAYAFGVTSLPVRSETARTFHWVWSVLACLSLMSLALYVFDATRLCVCFVDGLTRGDGTVFPSTARTVEEAEELGLSIPQASDLLTLRLLAVRTEAVGRLLLYPFAMTAVFVVARNGIFDSWSWPWAVSGLFVLMLLVLLMSGMHLQRSARRARWRVLRRLEERRLRLLGVHPPAAGWATEPQLEAMREQVRTLDRGAFASWQANPVLGALALPFGGAGAAWLVDVLLQFAG